jgi:hypothetical protein
MKIHLLYDKYYKLAELTAKENLVPRPSDYLSIAVNFPDGDKKDLLFIIAKTQYHFHTTCFTPPQREEPKEYCIEASAKSVTLHVHPASSDASSYVSAVISSKIVPGLAYLSE